MLHKPLTDSSHLSDAISIKGRPCNHRENYMLDMIVVRGWWMNGYDGDELFNVNNCKVWFMAKVNFFSYS